MTKETQEHEEALLICDISEGNYEVEFPKAESSELGQDQEWCCVKANGQKKVVRFHDYDEVYSIPGLYEKLFYEELKCNSPATIVDLLNKAIEDQDQNQEKLRILDVGAGNGMVGEELDKLNSELLVGIDIIPEAKEAVERDRPGLYDDYLVADLTDLKSEQRKRLEKMQLNCLTSVAALGFGDIPPEAFATAWNIVEEGSPVAFNIKKDFLDPNVDNTGFSALIERLIENDAFEVAGKKVYCHRYSVAGDQLFYLGLAGFKREEIPAEWLAECQ